MVGRIGNFAFDTDIQKNNEQRFIENYEKRKRHVETNIALAKQRNFLLDNFAAEVSESRHALSTKRTNANVSPLAIQSNISYQRRIPSRSGTRSTNPTTKSSSNKHHTLKDLIAQARKYPTNSVIPTAGLAIASTGASSVSGSKSVASRHRMLHIRGLKDLTSPKERLNEDFLAAVSEIRTKK